MIGRNDHSAQWGASFVVIAVERAAEARICAASNATRRIRLRKAQSGRSCLIVSTCRLKRSNVPIMLVRTSPVQKTQARREGDADNCAISAFPLACSVHSSTLLATPVEHSDLLTTAERHKQTEHVFDPQVGTRTQTPRSLISRPKTQKTTDSCPTPTRVKSPRAPRLHSLTP